MPRIPAGAPAAADRTVAWPRPVGAEAGAQQSVPVQLLQPLGIVYVALASRHALRLAGIDQQCVEAIGLEDFEHGKPVNPGRPHHDSRDLEFPEPPGKFMKIVGEATE